MKISSKQAEGKQFIRTGAWKDQWLIMFELQALWPLLTMCHFAISRLGSELGNSAHWAPGKICLGNRQKAVGSTGGLSQQGSELQWNPSSCRAGHHPMSYSRAIRVPSPVCLPYPLTHGHSAHLPNASIYLVAKPTPLLLKAWSQGWHLTFWHLESRTGICVLHLTHRSVKPQAQGCLFKAKGSILFLSYSESSLLLYRQ